MTLPSSMLRVANKVVVGVPLVIVRLRPAAAQLQGKARLRAIDGLDLTLPPKRHLTSPNHAS